MTMTIYGILTSRAMRPLWAAQELGLDFVHENMPFSGGATRTPEFLTINPNGHIPALVDNRPDGRVVVWESMACALYLAQQYGRADGSDLSPASPAENADALKWSFWTVTELEKDALTVLMHRLAMPEAQRKPELADEAQKRLKVPLQVLEDELARQKALGHDYLAGSRFTVADLCVASVVQWVRSGKGFGDGYALVQDWAQRCLGREALKALRQRSA
jgi:glutathione S-transferase